MLKDKDLTLSIVGSVIWNAYTPPESIGWPPGLMEHIKTMNHNLAITILNAIYTEEELNNKVEQIILDKP